MISIKVKFISILVFVLLGVLFVRAYPQDLQEGLSNSNGTGSRNIDVGIQKFDFSSPKSDLERAHGQAGGFPKIVIDKPVNPNEYVIGVGDTLLLVTFGKFKSNVPITVGPEGKVIIPDFGQLSLAKLTINQAKEKIISVMKKKYTGLEFDLLLADPRFFKIFVLGEVNNPGIYVASALDRVSDVILRAGGINQIGTYRKIEIRRNGKVDFSDLYLFKQNGDLPSNPYLLDNDIIFVPFSLPRITIGGGIRKPGVYELEGKEDINKLLNRIGGLSTKVSYEKPLKVVRIEGKKEKNTIELDLKDFVGGKAKPFFLQDGDSVWIPSIDEVAANEINIYVSGEVKKPGAYPFMPGYTAKAYIGIAGGLTSRARYSQTEIIKADGKKIPFREDTVLELGDTINVPERFMKVWQDCLTVATSISSLTLAVVAALK